MDQAPVPPPNQNPIRVAAARYGTANSGALQAQAPASKDGDGDIEMGILAVCVQSGQQTRASAADNEDVGGVAFDHVQAVSRKTNPARIAASPREKRNGT